MPTRTAAMDVGDGSSFDSGCPLGSASDAGGLAGLSVAMS
jgi:hypothetical protein